MRLDEVDKQITPSDLEALETFADRIFGKVGIDVEFTRHFLDRVNDERNGKQITASELTRLFKQEYKKWGKPIAQMGPDAEAVMKDLATDINMPFALRWDDKNKELDLIAKTVMRKPNFKTSNREFSVEGSPFDSRPKQRPQVDKHVNSEHGTKEPVSRAGNTMSDVELKSISHDVNNYHDREKRLEKGRHAIAVADPVDYKMNSDNSASSMQYKKHKSRARQYAANVRPDYYFKETVNEDGVEPSDDYRLIWRGISSEEAQAIHKSNGKTLPSKSNYPIWTDNELAHDLEISDSEAAELDKSQGAVINMTDKDNAEGYGNALMWVDMNYGLDFSRDYYTVQINTLSRLTYGKDWGVLFSLNEDKDISSMKMPEVIITSFKETVEKDMDEYKRLLKAHDWYYSYSDDHRYYTRGSDEYAVLRKLQAKLDPDSKIWKQYSPDFNESINEESGISKFNKEDPNNPEVLIQGYGSLMLNQIEDDLVRKFESLADMAKKKDWNNIDYQLNKTGVISAFIEAIISTKEQLQAVRRKGGPKSRGIAKESRTSLYGAIVGEDTIDEGMFDKLKVASHKKAYKHAAERLHTMLQRKYKENEGNWRHALGWYVSKIASSFSNVDSKILHKFYLEHYDTAFITEAGGVGKIVPGVNTTIDVGPDEIKKQAAKFGSVVDKDGLPKNTFR